MAYLMIKDQVVLIDDADYDWLSSYDWTISSSGYVITSTAPQTFMHRMILGLSERDILGDHRNWDKLDNRRVNLRVATYSQNGRHRKNPTQAVPIVNKSGITVYQVKVWFNSKHVYLGTFRTQKRAQVVMTYNLKRLELGLPPIALKRKHGGYLPKTNPVLRVHVCC